MAVDAEKAYQQDEMTTETSSEEEDKLAKVLKNEVLKDENDPDIDKTPEERAAIVRLM
jgi:hypothetical protein